MSKLELYDDITDMKNTIANLDYKKIFIIDSTDKNFHICNLTDNFTKNLLRESNRLGTPNVCVALFDLGSVKTMLKYFPNEYKRVHELIMFCNLFEIDLHIYKDTLPMDNYLSKMHHVTHSYT